MEIALRATLLDWLASDPFLAEELFSLTEEAPARSTLPWLAIGASASADWSVKGTKGREIRIAIELQARGDDPTSCAALVSAIEDRVATLPPDQPGMRIVTTAFLRARTEQRGATTRATLLEYRFRVLAN